MAGGAAGGFVARAFESMLKECANKKFNALQSAIQTYLDSGKDINHQSNVSEAKQVTSAAINESGSTEANSDADKIEGSDLRVQSSAEVVEPMSSIGSITTVLANAGHTLGEAEAELVLNPLRLAFETKNVKVVELALDCLHFSCPYVKYNYMKTIQPLELLNDLGFENRKYHELSPRERTISSPTVLKATVNGIALDHSQETVRLADTEGSEGLPSPSNRSVRSTDGPELQRSQTLGQKIMGNMRDNLFVRSFTSKPKNLASDVMVPSSPSKLSDATTETGTGHEEENPMLEIIRSKCITQLLLLGAIDGIQKKYWNKLNSLQKITMMEILFSVLEFAASYNSYANLRLRVHQNPAERPPSSILRQELTGTCIYLDILQKTTAAVKEEAEKEEKLEGVAEEKLVSFCEQLLRDASDIQSNVEETTNMEIHRILELRSPIIVKVLKGMCQMNPQIFRNHLRDFYPSITKLVCCDQMDIRVALSDLFTLQLSTLLP